MGSIREALADGPRRSGRTVDLGRDGTRPPGRRSAQAPASIAATALADRSVVVATRDPLAAALTLIELDGVARRLLLCAPDVTRQELAPLAARAGADAIVTDGEPRGRGYRCSRTRSLRGRPGADEPATTRRVTRPSGCCSRRALPAPPKLVRHTLGHVDRGHCSCRPAGERESSGAPSTTSGATAACRSSCGRSRRRRIARPRKPGRERRSITSSGSPNTAPPTSPARRRTGAAS